VFSPAHVVCMNYCNIEHRYRADQPDAFNLPETMTETCSANQQDIKLVLPQIPPASFSRLIAGTCRTPPHFHLHRHNSVNN
jgi:hypothetical protein